MESINHSSRPEASVVNFRGVLLSANNSSFNTNGFSVEELEDISRNLIKTPIPVCIGLAENGKNPYGFTTDSKLINNELLVDATICHGVVKQLIVMNMIFMTLKTSLVKGKIIPEFIALNPIYTYTETNQKPVSMID